MRQTTSSRTPAHSSPPGQNEAVHMTSSFDVDTSDDVGFWSSFQQPCTMSLASFVIVRSNKNAINSCFSGNQLEIFYISSFEPAPTHTDKKMPQSHKYTIPIPIVIVNFPIYTKAFKILRLSFSGPSEPKIHSRLHYFSFCQNHTTILPTCRVP
jgi:hypothetical protein